MLPRLLGQHSSAVTSILTAQEVVGRSEHADEGSFCLGAVNMAAENEIRGPSEHVKTTVRPKAKMATAAVNPLVEQHPA
jgi:hypothetical protein